LPDAVWPVWQFELKVVKVAGSRIGELGQIGSIFFGVRGGTGHRGVVPLILTGRNHSLSGIVFTNPD